MSGSYNLRAIFASSPKTTRGQPTVLKTDPKGQKLVYTNGTTVYIRNLENPSECDTYTEHSKETGVAAYAPSGNYVASGDAGGKVRIWDALRPEHILKYEYQVLGGAIKDIAWTEDSKRIAVGGEGKEKFAHVFMWDTGTSVGTLAGMSKSVNNVDIKQNRPYRCVTASEDYTTCYFEGPPFKFKGDKREHSNFVNCVRYAPDGSFFATGGSDGKCFLYDGKTGELAGQMNEAESRIHKGGVYAISWSPDSKELFTVSADKTAKIWDVEKRTLATEFKFEDKIENQLVGGIWAGSHLVALSLNGNINYLDRENPASPAKIIKGHNKAIMAIAITEDKQSIFSASYDGLLCQWNVNTGAAEKVPGKSHTNQVNSMSISGNYLVSCGMDDMVRFVNVPGGEFLDDRIGMDSQPKSVAAGKDGLVVVACINEIVVIRNQRVVHHEPVDFEPSAIALHPSEAFIAVGSSKASPLALYDLDHDVLKNKRTCGGSGMEIRSWGYHAAKVNDVAISPDSCYLATCSVDTYVNVWSIKENYVTHKMRACHGMAVNITTVRWLDNNTLVTADVREFYFKEVETNPAFTSFQQSSLPSEEIKEIQLSAINIQITMVSVMRFVMGMGIAAILICDIMMPAASIPIAQTLFKNMMKRRREKHRHWLLRHPNMVSMRKIEKRVISGDRRLLCVRLDNTGKCLRYKMMFLWG
eukprot:gene5444-6126_t